MKNVFYEGKVLWSQVDANMHLRHSAYADFAAQARLEILGSLGFNADLLEQLHVGPILFREELIYMRYHKTYLCVNQSQTRWFSLVIQTRNVPK
jgi:acyl-CoA thioester hydrolase